MFFLQHPTKTAEQLIGAKLSYGPTSGVIVETEAYSELNDEACHTFFRKKARDFVETNKPGTAYIYLNYGVYWLANILTKAADGERGFVLIRALEPVAGIELMKERRQKEKLTDLCSGPGKLTIAMGIGPQHHELDFLGNPFVITPREQEPEILTGPRIGISKAKELPWRYGLKGSKHLSQRF
ncbi:MAG: DNA-3-methyladenine glycosylase [Verrucomicrobiota bacterium JB023]|nr:DNA-3-methyladenine glycosylase [Verrucomicrobiota bacterium JB023]